MSVSLPGWSPATGVVGAGSDSVNTDSLLILFFSGSAGFFLFIHSIRMVVRDAESRWNACLQNRTSKVSSLYEIKYLQL